MKNSKLSPQMRDPAEAGQFKIKNLSSKFKTFNFSLLTFNFQRGQALITLLFFVLISLTITSAAIIIIIANSLSASKLEEGTRAYYTAESGMENALLRLLRDPNYTSETLVVEDGTVSVTVTGVNPKTITSVGQNGNFKRTVQTQMTYNGGYYTFSNWREL